MTQILKDKHIVLGVCGGIAAYKSVEVLRLFQKGGARVRVIMTENACWFVGPLTFEALSGRPVFSRLFEEGGEASIRHIDWAQQAHAVVIAPATANMVGKLAHGIADDALSTFMLAVTSPVMICPSMNTHMYQSRPVQRNLDILRADGYVIVEPRSGQLACGTIGPGRLPEPDDILDRLVWLLTPKDLAGKHVLVTAGPTVESIDPVRFISNPSSGKMGFCVARAAEYRGARVTLISGPTHLPDPINVQPIRVKSAREMADAVFDHMAAADIIVKTAAVADYRPKNQRLQKIKKDAEDLTLSLEKTTDILKRLGQEKTHQIIVGFAAETENLETNAQKKLTSKNLDIIVGNMVGQPDSGFGTDTNTVTFFYRDGSREVLPTMEKEAVAHLLFDRILAKVMRLPSQAIDDHDAGIHRNH
jgi:phosphopantothenoylcysteine decarboxylase / phosphopantothenate---cysteine ligase